MTQDISNKTLAILAGIAIVVSVIGLFIRGAPVSITGMANANETGTVQGTIQSNVQVNLSDATINFGNIRNEEVFDSWNITSGADWLTSKNIGTTAIEVDFWSKNALFYDFWNDTSKHCNGNTSSTSNCRGSSSRNETDPSYKFKVTNLSTSGAGCLIDSKEVYTNVIVDGESGAAAPQVADSLAAGDLFNISIYIDVPKYEQSGAVSTNVYVSATEDTNGKAGSC